MSFHAKKKKNASDARPSENPKNSSKKEKILQSDPNAPFEKEHIMAFPLLRRSRRNANRCGSVGVHGRAGNGVDITAIEVTSVDSVISRPRLRVHGADLALDLAVLHQVVGGKVLASGGSGAVRRRVSDVVSALGGAGSSATLDGVGSTIVP